MSTTTSTVPTRSKSSTSQVSPAQSVTAQIVAPNNVQNHSDWLANNANWLVPTFIGLIVAAVIGYFTQIMQLKEDIAKNKNEISLAQKDIDYLKVEDQKNQEQLSEIDKLKLDFAVTTSQINQLSKKNK